MYTHDVSALYRLRFAVTLNKNHAFSLGSPIHYNTDQLQPAEQVFCSHLCLYVLKELSVGHKFQKVLNKLS